MQPKGLPPQTKSKGGVPFLPGPSNDNKKKIQPKGLPPPSESKGGVPFLPGHSNDKKKNSQPNKGLHPPTKSKGGVPILPGHSNEEKILIQPKGLTPPSKSEEGIYYAPRNSIDEKTILMPFNSDIIKSKNNVKNDAYFETFLQKDLKEIYVMTSPGVDLNCVIMDYMFEIVINAG